MLKILIGNEIHLDLDQINKKSKSKYYYCWFSADEYIDRVTRMQTPIYVPSVQRGFAWGQAQKEKFYKDVFEKHTTPMPSIFLHYDRKNKLNIYDGLQRTITILENKDAILKSKKQKEIVIPAVIFTGTDSEAAKFFETINSSAVKLTEYELLASVAQNDVVSNDELIKWTNDIRELKIGKCGLKPNPDHMPTLYDMIYKFTDDLASGKNGVSYKNYSDIFKSNDTLQEKWFLKYLTIYNEEKWNYNKKKLLAKSISNFKKIIAYDEVQHSYSEDNLKNHYKKIKNILGQIYSELSYLFFIKENESTIFKPSENFIVGLIINIEKEILKKDRILDAVLLGSMEGYTNASTSNIPEKIRQEWLIRNDKVTNVEVAKYLLSEMKTVKKTYRDYAFNLYLLNYVNGKMMDNLYKSYDGDEIHIDHIIPQSILDEIKEFDVKIWKKAEKQINSFENLNLLPGKLNLEKGNTAFADWLDAKIKKEIDKDSVCTFKKVCDVGITIDEKYLSIIREVHSLHKDKKYNECYEAISKANSYRKTIIKSKLDAILDNTL